MPASTNENKKAILPGPRLLFETPCAPEQCPPSQALRFQTKCRPQGPGTPLSTGLNLTGTSFA